MVSKEAVDELGDGLLGATFASLSCSSMAVAFWYERNKKKIITEADDHLRW